MTTAPDRGSSSTAPHPRQNRRPRFALLAVTATCLIGLVATSTAGAAQAPVGLGTATGFAILAGAAITNTGDTTIIDGDVGNHPTGTQTGFEDVTFVNGVNHGDDAITVQAKADLLDAYNDAAGRTPVTERAVELGGATLTAGVYDTAAGTFGLTGELTLDAEGDPDAVFVFQTESTLITTDNSTVTLIGDASPCNVFWQVGSSATLGTNSNFVGSVLALTSITLTTGAEVEGRMLARNGAVTLDNNTITNPDCATIAPTPTPTTTTSPGDDDTDGEGDSMTPDQSTTGPGGPGTPGAPTDGSGTPVGSGPPGAGPPTELAFTGTDPRLAVVGIASLLAGVMCLVLSPARRRARA